LVCHIGNSGEWAIIASTTAPGHANAAGNAAGRGFFAFASGQPARFFRPFPPDGVGELPFAWMKCDYFHMASFLLVVFAQVFLQRKKPLY
jgi:hypothetical protein